MNPGPPAGPPVVLTSWKEIARYLGKGVRTVQRWEQDFGLPVRRPRGSSKKAVLARPQDLDAWVALRCGSRTPAASDISHNGMHLNTLLSLSAGIETHRQLQEYNRMLTDEVRAALIALRDQLSSLQQAGR